MDITRDFISIPISDKNFLHMEPTATLAAVSLALARSKTFRTSLWLYFSVPGKSACPGTIFVCRLISSFSFTGSIAIAVVQFSQSLFSIHKDIGDPSVLPCLTPDFILALSFSIFILPPEPYPFCLLDISIRIYSSLNDKFEGIPSKITVNPIPCDSPAVKNLNFVIIIPLYL